MSRTPIYDPTVFNVGSEAEAKAIILTPEAGKGTTERWDEETPDIVRKILQHDPQAERWLDWGCGIGRIAKPLITTGRKVVGVDFSADMRRLARGYCPEMPTYAPEQFDQLLDEHGAFDGAYAVWALQHIPKLEQACRHLFLALKPGGTLIVLNRAERVIPVLGGWMPDGKSVPDALYAAGFKRHMEIELGAPLYEPGSFWSVWERAA